MNKNFFITLLIPAIFFAGCESASDKVNDRFLDLQLSSEQLKIGEKQILTLAGENIMYDSVRFNASPVQISQRQYEFSYERVGSKSIEVKAFKDGDLYSGKVNFIVYPRNSAHPLPFEIVRVLKHDEESYTQGLEISGDTMFESKGQYGSSAILKYALSDLKRLKEYSLPQNHFGEGLSILGDTVYQLTWRENICHLYDKNLNTIGTLTLPSTEGWGLCNNGRQLFYSDGSHRLLILDRNLQLLDRLEVYNGSKALNQLNELEIAQGKIFANVYQRQQVFVINPRSGAAEGFIDFSPLRQYLQNPKAEVLNGIAYNKGSETFYITGKYWDKMFEIRIKGYENLF